MPLAEGTSSECRWCGTICLWETLYRWHSRQSPPVVIEEGDQPYQYKRVQYWHHFAPVDLAHPQNCPPSEEMVNNHSTGWKDELKMISKRCMPTGYCNERLTSDRSAEYGQPCNRPVVDDELFMCGIHAGKERERLRQKAASEARRAHQDFLEDYVENVVKPKLAAAGFPGETLLSWQTWKGDTQTRIVLDMDNFIAWLDELEKRLANTGD